MMSKISRFLTDYKIQKRRIDDVISFKDSLKATLGSLVLTILILLIPSLLVYNLLIFQNIRILLYIIIIIIFITFAFLYHFLYIQIIKIYYEKLKHQKFNVLIIIESSVVALILVVFAIIVISIF